MTRLALVLKAEVVFGLLLVVRHRAVRLSGVLALAIVALGVADRAEGGGFASVQSLLLGGGVLTAVATSRPLAPGAAVWAARRVAAAWWLVPAGRLGGVLTLILPLIAVSIPALGLSAPTGPPIAFAVAVFVAALGALVLALSPVIGASAAAPSGFFGALLGALPPSTVADVLSPWAPVQNVAVLLWNVLPLSWRAVRWLDGGGGHGAILLAWIGLGVGGAALTLAHTHRLDGVPPAEGR